MHDDQLTVAATWLQTGRGDFHVAELLVEEMPAAACFHAQQAAEKAVKAVLVSIAGDAPRMHALRALFYELTSLNETLPSEILACGKLLDQFYMPTRYPDALGGIDPHSVYSTKQSADALTAARTIIDWAQTRLA